MSRDFSSSRECGWPLSSRRIRLKVSMFLKLSRKIRRMPQFLRSTRDTNSVFAVMSDTQTPQGVLALVRQFSYGMDELLKSDRPAHLMVLENLQDPGNLGTILRAGEGAGITGLIMSRDTVDIYNPKVIRSTMGSVFRVPFFYTDDLEQTVLDLKARGIRVFAAHLAGKNNYEQEDYTGNTAFLTEELSAAADAWVKIPMAGKVESLNAAIAASILMFETARQRRA